MRVLLFLVCLCCSWSTTQGGVDYMHQHRIQNSIRKLDRQTNPELCCYPDVWQGRRFYYLTKLDTPAEEDFYVDGKNMRIAIDTSITIRNVTISFMDMLLCDKSNTCTKYYIDRVKKTCEKREVVNTTTSYFWPLCMPQKASHLGTFRMGSVDSDSLLLESWIWPFRLTVNVTWERLVTAKDCLPIMEIQCGDRGVLFSQYYFDVRKKIVDPSIFDPPSFCTEYENVKPADENRRHYFGKTYFDRLDRFKFDEK